MYVCFWIYAWMMDRWLFWWGRGEQIPLLLVLLAVRCSFVRSFIRSFIYSLSSYDHRTINNKKPIIISSPPPYSTAPGQDQGPQALFPLLTFSRGGWMDGWIGMKCVGEYILTYGYVYCARGGVVGGGFWLFTYTYIYCG